MFVRSGIALSFSGALLLLSASAHAHVTLISGPGFAKQSQVVMFGIGHGCSGADTVKLEVSMPKEVASVRALPNVFGDTKVVVNDAGVPTSVVWSKDKPRASDDLYYQMGIRITVPDAAFTTVYFAAKQTCRTADGTETVVDWSALPGDAPPADGEESTPAPALTILPARVTGWNKFTVPSAISDLTIFNDAQIVWSGDAAYSGNAATSDLIKAEAGVTQLSEIKAGAEIWVKY